MGPRNVPSGKDFFEGGDHFAEMKDFGFAGSMQGYESHPVAPPFAGDRPESGPHNSVETTPAYAHGGMHMHPHGHHVTHVKHHPDGTVVHHHAHGGYSVHHGDGHVTHHAHGGEHVSHHMAHGGQHMDGGMPMGAHPEGSVMHAHGGMHHAGMSHPHGHHVTHVQHTRHGEVEHHAHGGYSVHHHDGHTTHHMADGSPAHMKNMMANAVHQHEDHEHGGEHTSLHLARGGAPHMRHKAGTGHPLTEGSALNRPPMEPRTTRTPRNTMPGGQMGYGMEPSDEAGNMPTQNEEGMGGTSGMTQMRRGGMHRAAKHAKGGHHKSHKGK